MRRKIIAGNWKMNKTPSEAKQLIEELLPLVKTDETDVVFCVPSVSIVTAYLATKDTNVAIGAQNMYFEEKGAFTGEISAAMLCDAGAKYIIIGHSERRRIFGETDEIVNRKIKKAFEHGLIPIICCGESLEQREENATLEVVKSQIESAFDQVLAQDAKNAVIAYEPIWAIGTGRVATSTQAEEVCAFIRNVIKDLYDADVSEAIRIQYGGSVTADSAAEILNQPNIDGALVGGASLKADFAKIVNYNK